MPMSIPKIILAFGYHRALLFEVCTAHTLCGTYAFTYIPSIAVDVDFIEFFQENKNPSGREVFVFPVGPPARKHFQLTDYRKLDDAKN
jgi:hypothetical protein